MTAEELIAERGEEIAQVVRGEEMRLAEDERDGDPAIAPLLLSGRPGGDRLDRRAGL